MLNFKSIQFVLHLLDHRLMLINKRSQLPALLTVHRDLRYLVAQHRIILANDLYPAHAL
jgi:hypothetical protein